MSKLETGDPRWALHRRRGGQGGALPGRGGGALARAAAATAPGPRGECPTGGHAVRAAGWLGRERARSRDRLDEPHRRRRLGARRARAARSSGGGGTAGCRRAARDSRAAQDADGKDGRPRAVRADRLSQGAADDGRHERRRHHRDPAPRARREGAPRGRRSRGVAREHAGSPRGHRPLQARPGRGREDPLRPVPVIATTKIRVRYAETDCMKVVYYGNYLTYFEVARVEFLRQQGQAMSDVDQKVHMPVVEAVVRYHKPALLDDLLEARCWIAERKRASFRFGYELVNERGERVASGSTLHACWDPATSKMIAVPDWLAAIMPVTLLSSPSAV